MKLPLLSPIFYFLLFSWKINVKYFEILISVICLMITSFSLLTETVRRKICHLWWTNRNQYYRFNIPATNWQWIQYSNEYRNRTNITKICQKSIWECENWYFTYVCPIIIVTENHWNWKTSSSYSLQHIFQAWELIFNAKIKYHKLDIVIYIKTSAW